MTPKQRGAALTDIAHVQAHASTLHDLLSRMADIREIENRSTWMTDVAQARELLGKALAHCTRYAVA
jgi:hypothetical protein